jgi:hypothetical protein
MAAPAVRPEVAHALMHAHDALDKLIAILSGSFAPSNASETRAWEAAIRAYSRKIASVNEIVEGRRDESEQSFAQLLSDLSAQSSPR